MDFGKLDKIIVKFSKNKMNTKQAVQKFNGIGWKVFGRIGKSKSNTCTILCLFWITLAGPPDLQACTFSEKTLIGPRWT